MVNEVMCRMCGQEPVDPDTGSYEMCTDCWADFESELDEYEALWDYYGISAESNE
jgi:hypothetical protein